MFLSCDFVHGILINLRNSCDHWNRKAARLFSSVFSLFIASFSNVSQLPDLCKFCTLIWVNEPHEAESYIKFPNEEKTSHRTRILDFLKISSISIKKLTSGAKRSLKFDVIYSCFHLSSGWENESWYALPRQQISNENELRYTRSHLL